MRRAYSTRFDAHNELHDIVARERQIELAIALERAGLGDAILNHAPISVPQNLCQWRARDLRIRFIQDAVETLVKYHDRGAILATCTIVDRRWRSRKRPISSQGAERVVAQLVPQLPKELAALFGCVEVDFCVSEEERFWRRTVHAVLAIHADDLGHVKRLMKFASSLSASADVRRPLVIRDVTDLGGALRYATKSLAFGSTIQRSTWSGLDSRGRPRKFTRAIKLKPAQRDELLLAMMKTPPEARLLRVEVPTQHS